MINIIDPAMQDGMTLAYMGDSVIELYIRQCLINEGVSGSGSLNEIAQRLVSAKGQVDAYRRISPMLTDIENDIFHRGRNSGHLKKPKHSTLSEYRISTGFEAIFGYLYLSGEKERTEELLLAAYPAPIKEIKETKENN